METDNESWKPSFWETAKSRSWTDHLILYFITFGIIIWAVFNPQTSIEWIFIVLLNVILTLGYWSLMINFQRSNIQKMNSSLLQQQKELEKLEEQLKQLNNDKKE